MLDADDAKKALEIMSLLPGSFIGGSYIVDPTKARDIDVVVSYGVWTLRAEMVMSEFGQSEQRFLERKAEYEGNPDVQEIHYYGNVNLIVASDEMLAAYKAAVREMRNNPELYSTRDERIELHQGFKRTIRSWLGI